MLTSQGEATGFREQIGTTILAEKPGGSYARTESLRVSESERREELELSEVHWMCLRNPGINMMSQADTSGGHIMENQQEKKRKRDIQANERKMVRFEQEAPITSAPSDPQVALEHLVRDETPSRPGSVLVQKVI